MGELIFSCMCLLVGGGGSPSSLGDFSSSLSDELFDDCEEDDDADDEDDEEDTD